MLCQACNKNEANLHYTKIINGEVEELHLCEECSKNNGEFDFDKTFSFHKILTELIDGVQDKTVEKETEEIYCEKCNLSYSEFKQTGKLGCDECYTSFKEKLLPIIKSVQGNQKHLGKIPSRANEGIKIKRQLSDLKKELETKIQKEEFEEAATLRDEIKEIEKELNKEGE